MYSEFFGLKTKPFSLSPDPRFLYLSKNHLRAKTMLEYGILNHSGFTVITGDIGTGKTTVVLNILHELRGNEVVGLINNTYSGIVNIIDCILDAFNIEIDISDYNKKIKVFNDFVLKCYSEGKIVLLVIDEAQNLSEKILEDLRLISNINISSDVYFQVVLVGQPQLIDKLNKPELAQFSQRIGVEFNLRPMDFEDTINYVKYRMSYAGGNENIFCEDAIALIFIFSEGVARKINTLCDMSLMYAFADDSKVIDGKLVMEMIKDRTATAIVKQDVAIHNEELNRVKLLLKEKYSINLSDAI